MNMFKIKPSLIGLVIVCALTSSVISGTLYTRYAAGPFRDLFGTGKTVPEVKCNSSDECNIKGFEIDHIIAGYPVSYFWSDYRSQQYYNKDLILIKQQNKKYNPSKISIEKFIINFFVWAIPWYLLIICVKEVSRRKPIRFLHRRSRRANY